MNYEFNSSLTPHPSSLIPHNLSSPTATAAVAPQYTEQDDERAENPGDNHCLAEIMMPAGQRCIHQHAAADHEPRGSDGAGEPFEVAADATSQGLHARGLNPAQVAFGDAPEDAARVFGRITYQTLHVARELGCLFLYPCH